MAYGHRVKSPGWNPQLDVLYPPDAGITTVGRAEPRE